MAGGKRRKLGQHFLIDNSVVAAIIDAASLAPGDAVVEVGPGPGVLTRALLGAGVRLTTVEIDERLHGALQEEYAGDERITLVRANALYYAFGDGDGPFKIVSNLPYSVSTPLAQHFLTAGPNLIAMTLMVQEEVGRRFCAAAGEKGYGSLSVFLDYYCEREYLFTVPPEAFRPPPRVQSAVVRLTPRQRPPVVLERPENFFTFVKLGFRHRRKTIRNNYRDVWEGPLSFDDACAEAKLDPGARPEVVSLHKFVALYAHYADEGMQPQNIL